MTSPEREVTWVQDDAAGMRHATGVDGSVCGGYHPMVNRFGRIAAFVLSTCTLGFASPPEATEETLLWFRLHQIEMAFRKGDAAGLRRAFVDRCRVRVNFVGSPGPRVYGPGQLEVIFEQVFRESRTEAFRFPDEDVNLTPAGTAFARGYWSRRRSGQPLAVENLTFMLREQGGEWRILEIQSSG